MHTVLITSIESCVRSAVGLVDRLQHTVRHRTFTQHNAQRIQRTATVMVRRSSVAARSGRAPPRAPGSGARRLRLCRPQPSAAAAGAGLAAARPRQRWRQCSVATAAPGGLAAARRIRTRDRVATRPRAAPARPLHVDDPVWTQEGTRAMNDGFRIGRRHG